MLDKIKYWSIKVLVGLLKTTKDISIGIDRSRFEATLLIMNNNRVKKYWKAIENKVAENRKRFNKSAQNQPKAAKVKESSNSIRIVSVEKLIIKWYYSKV